jgi:diguanylate cyclase (GGDEF)-like protein
MLLNILEMLIVNLFLIDQCSEKKYSATKTYSIFTLLAIVLLIPSSLIVFHLPNFGNGNGLFIFCGFLFVIPIKLLYKNSFAKIVCLGSMVWIYTFLLFSISVHVSHLIEWFPYTYTVFVIQTTFYLLSFTWFYKKLKLDFLVTISRLNDEETRSLMWMSIIWFCGIFIINLSFVYWQSNILRIVALGAFAVCAYCFNLSTYHVIKKNHQIVSLEQMAYHDNLTQLRTRSLLTKDVDQLISRGISFSFVFMDLDNFKQINDRYGHSTGDEYLSFFAQETKKIIGNNGGFYRIAGDEFIGILIDSDEQELVAKLGEFPKTINDAHVPFLGVSYGVSIFPTDGATYEQLMEIADARMYAHKKEKPVNYSTGA